MMFDTIKRILTRTLYRKMVLGLTLIMALVMTLFGWEMTRRQELAEKEQRSNQAMAMARGLATTSAVWVAARDFSGLQEIVSGLARYPDLRHAMVLDTRGQILAHQEVARRGQYLEDLPVQPELHVVLSSPGMIDVVSPVMLADRHIGWARVGLASDTFAAELDKIKRDAAVYIVFSIVLGACFAALAVRYLIRRLHAVQRVANAVQNGQWTQRAVVAGDDEAAQLAKHFNAMLDRLAQREEDLQESENLLSATQHLGGIGGWQWDVEQQRLRWTTETYRIHDMAPESASEVGSEHVAQSIACYAPQDRDKVMKAFAACVAHGEPYDMEVAFVSCKQRELWVRTIGQPVRQGDRIVKVFGYIMDITERRALEQEIRSLAYFDPLTKLPNRRMFEDRLRVAMAASQRSGQLGALMYLDLDNFKPINDTHGHAAGDLLLMEVANRLTNCVREIDTVSRTGGDEFEVILGTLDADPAIARAQAMQIAEKIRVTLAQPYLLTLPHAATVTQCIEHRCTASVGVVVFVGQQASQEDVIKWADAAMYQSKAGGRNRIVLHQDAP